MVPSADSDGSLEAFPVTSTTSDSAPVAEHRAPATAAAVTVQTSAIPSPMASVAERLITHANADTVVVEQYRRLAAILHQAQVERGVKVVMLASAQTAEGKTLTAVNLALTLSESYKRRVLLIDADLRRPSVAKVFGVVPGSGLSECLKAVGTAGPADYECDGRRSAFCSPDAPIAIRCRASPQAACRKSSSGRRRISTG